MLPINIGGNMHGTCEWHKGQCDGSKSFTAIQWDTMFMHAHAPYGSTYMTHMHTHVHVQKIDIEWKFSVWMQNVTVRELDSWMQTPMYMTIYGTWTSIMIMCIRL